MKLLSSLILIATAWSTSSISALLSGNHQESQTEKACETATNNDNGFQFLCMTTAVTTSLPTVYIDDQMLLIDTPEALAVAFTEVEMNPNETVVSKKLAGYFNVSVLDIQTTLNDLYDAKIEITLESIKSAL